MPSKPLFLANFMLRTFNRQALSVSCFILLLAALLVSPLWDEQGLPGIHNDMLLHMHRAAAVARSFEQGVFWPRWLPIAYQGLGGPVFHHYSPGFHWLVAATHTSGFRLDEAVKLVFTAAFVLSGFCVYGWLRRTFSVQASLIGAALYLAQPKFLLRGIYYYGDYPQMLGILVLPACLWAIDALHARGSPWNWLYAVGSLTALVFSHNITALVGAFILLIYWLMLAILYGRPDSLMRCALAAFTAAATSAIFWLPAVADLSYVQIDDARSGYFEVGNHFLSLRELLYLAPVFLDSSAGNPLTLPSSTYGWPQILAVVAGLLSALFAARRDLRVWGFFGGLFALAMLTLTLPVSEPVWHAIPGLDFIQFPFRLVPFATLGAVAACGAAIDAWAERRRWVPTLVLLLGSILIIFPFLFPRLISISSITHVERLSVEESLDYERTYGLWGFAASKEFLGKGADLRYAKREREEPQAVKPVWHSPHRAVADLAGQTGSLLRLHYHPGWSAEPRAALTPGPDGWTEVKALQNPERPLVIRWEGTVWERRGKLLSMFGLLAALAGFLFFAVRWRRGERGEWGVKRAEAPSASRFVPLMAGCMVTFLMVRYLLVWTVGGPFLWHSSPGEVPFRVEGQPETIGNSETGQMTLLGWKLLSSSNPKPGDTVFVRFFWQAQGQVDGDLRTLLHLYTPSLQQSWATENKGEIRPPTSVWDPASYYIETMRLTLPTDIPPVAYSLVTGLSSSSGERLQVPGSTDGLMHLREMSVAPLRPGRFQRVRPSTIASGGTNDGLQLQGYDLSDGPAGYSFRLFWETGQGVERDWITYIHLTDSRGELAAQFDGPALAGLEPTSMWKPNRLYIDRRKLELPADLVPGSYLLRVGLYSLESGERLHFQPEDAEQGHFEDGQLLVPINVQSEVACPMQCGPSDW